MLRAYRTILGLALRPLSGYDSGKWMDGPGRFVGYRVALPQVYRTLGKLVARGLVAAVLENDIGDTGCIDEGRGVCVRGDNYPKKPS